MPFHPHPLMMISFVFLPLIFSSVIAHEHQANRRLPSATWHHSRDHSVSDLFRRDANDGTHYPAVGTPEWASKYPPWTPDPSQMPGAWRDRLNVAVAAGKVPNTPIPYSPGDQNPTYPEGHDPMSPEICSATYKCRIDGDIWDGPSGFFGTSFDDGPLPTSGKLYDFLKEKNETATNFMIGSNVLENPDMFLRALTEGHDLAVHTWTHPYMTTQTNEQVVAELGWTMQIIHDSSGGRVPKYWRPPYGDSDTRVTAIAREVFGLTTIIWNQDTEDWSLISGGTTLDVIQNSMTQWLTGPKEPGLVILEHETSDLSVQAFINAYPLIKSNGWTTKSLAQIANDTDTSPYRNAPSTQDGPVLAEDIIVLDDTKPHSSTLSSNNSSTSSPTSATSSANAGPSAHVSTSSQAQSSQYNPPQLSQSNSALSILSTAGWTSAAFALTHLLISSV
ncbi:hypothetical protein D9758_001048 [Tetrapyrgos nigripes]|uniref:chitin deacetylase n=1 Tax=Tetrapyrgos nigripes TaxID=182062 RepID=A0A8H5GS36_9AGAR|nr:hypothetical protein D9758_001048 [Tetrapyrgos nigripes]